MVVLLTKPESVAENSEAEAAVAVSVSAFWAKPYLKPVE